VATNVIKLRWLQCSGCKLTTPHHLEGNSFVCQDCGALSLESPDCSDFDSPPCGACPNFDECWTAGDVG